jgi:hypothetical protein
MTRILPRTHQAPPPDSVLRQLRVPFVRRASLLRGDAEEEVFVIDIGLAGVFVERAEALEHDARVSIRFPWPGSERPFEARCRVAWWHPEGEALSSKSLPPGGGLEFVDMSEADAERLRALLLEHCQQKPSVRRFLRHWPEAERHGDDPTAG